MTIRCRQAWRRCREMTLLSFFRSKPTHKKQYDEDDQDDANDTDPTVAVAVAAEAATEATKHRASLVPGFNQFERI